MKIFLDTAEIESIRRTNDTGPLDGVTTNPMKIAETGRPFHSVVEQIWREKQIFQRANPATPPLT